MDQAGKNICINWTTGNHAILAFAAQKAYRPVRCADFALRHFSQSREKRAVVWLPHPPEPCPTAHSASRHTHCGRRALRITASDALCPARAISPLPMEPLSSVPLYPGGIKLSKVSRWLILTCHR